MPLIIVLVCEREILVELCGFSIETQVSCFMWEIKGALWVAVYV